MGQIKGSVATKERPEAAFKGVKAGAFEPTDRPSCKHLGKQGEEIAVLYLMNNEVDILERNWRCTWGEADIIALEGEDLVFIEVKTRSSYNAGFPEDAVTRQKRSKYEKIALHYFATHSHFSSRVRFDVIAVVMTGEMQALVRHHRDAFSAGE